MLRRATFLAESAVPRTSTYGGAFIVCSWGNWLTVHEECSTATSRRIHSELALSQAL